MRKHAAGSVAPRLQVAVAAGVAHAQRPSVGEEQLAGGCPRAVVDLTRAGQRLNPGRGLIRLDGERLDGERQEDPPSRPSRVTVAEHRGPAFFVPKPAEVGRVGDHPGRRPRWLCPRLRVGAGRARRSTASAARGRVTVETEPRQPVVVPWMGGPDTDRVGTRARSLLVAEGERILDVQVVCVRGSAVAVRHKSPMYPRPRMVLRASRSGTP
jgi:hypothetical protein